MLSASPGSHGVHLYCLGPVDDGLRITAMNLLQSCGYAALRRLWCEVTEGVVIIHGVVQSHYLKQLVQTIAQRVDGIQGMMNLVEVLEPDSWRSLSNEDAAFFSEEVGPDHPTRFRH